MGLWDRIVGREPVELLEWVEPASHDAMAVHHTGLRLRAGAALLVRQGQACVVSSGGVADVVGPGRHQLSSSALPRLAAAKVVRNSGGTFRADVSFVSVTPHTSVPWATVASVVARDAHNVPIPAKASGEIGFVVSDPVKFVREVVAPGDAPGASRAEVAALVTSQFGEIFRTGGLDGADLLGPTGRLGLVAGEQLAATLRVVGLTLVRFAVKNVSVASETRRLPGAFSDVGVDGYHAELPAPLFPEFASRAQESGLPALPAELADILEPPLPRNTGPKSARLPIVNDAPEGIFAARQQVTGPQSDRLPLAETENDAAHEHLFDPPLAPSARPRTIHHPLVEHPALDSTPAPTSAPTPLPVARPPGPSLWPAILVFHVAIDGAAAGPFDPSILAARVRDGSLGRRSLVWRPGMDAWRAAEAVTELATLFEGPPPIPPESPPS